MRLSQRKYLSSVPLLLSLALAGCSGTIEGADGSPGGSSVGGPSVGGSTSAGGSGSAAGAGNSTGLGAGSSAATPVGSGGSASQSGAGAGPGAGGAASSTGVAGAGPGTSGGTSGVQPAAGPCTGSEGLTSRRVRRLALREYFNVVTDLLGASAGAEAKAKFDAEPRVGGFDNQDDFLFVSPSLMENISDLAATLASKADPTALAPCATAGGSPACQQTFIRTFAAKAYGRPMTDEEFARATTVAATGQDYATSVRLIVELVLQSPGTLYVSELGSPTAPAAPGQPIELTPYEKASQLSFMLSGTRPDAALLQSVATNALAKPADVQREAERMLATDRAKVELKRFIDGWLDMGPIGEAPKVPTVFPLFTPAVVTAMQQEYDAFVTTQLKGGEGTLSSFMTATSTNIPAALAPIYGADLQGNVLDPQRRRGVLSLPGLLTFHSADYHSGPVERGLLVRRQLLCQFIPGPPQTVLDRIAANPLDAADTTKTTRQKFEMHLNEDSCRGCHQSFDPIGFGLEQMDGLGRFRTTENGQPVDSKGELAGADVGGTFEGPAQLSALLAPSKMLQSCMVEHFFMYAQARPSTTTDACVVQDWDSKFSQGGGRIKDLVLSYVVHPSFANRKDDR
ncbi:MAG TPA: DUF1592 domain-containing protein [Polyangiaceae bacterium]|nr:DUF1592 domain-containing protein [Polyangiaceae bacterium]